MFAFAIWDRRRQSLFCARDRLGIKPFYYTLAQGRLIFGSEIKVLLEAKGVHRRINRRVLPEYLAFGYLSGPQTLFEGIQKLLPGHWLRCEGGQVVIERYWSLPLVSTEEKLSAQECAEQFEHLFVESVRLRLMSDVPLGAFLSGGLDSSAVVSVMSEFSGNNRIKTFSVGYAESQYSELGFARQAAEHLGAEHREVMLERSQFFSLLPKLIWHEDEPIVWPSSISLYLVSQLASQHVKVVLTGEGSDELLAGYDRYWATVWNVKLGRLYSNSVPDSVQRKVRGLLEGAVSRRKFGQKLRHSFLNYSTSFEDIYLSNFVANFSKSEVSGILGLDRHGGNSGSYETPLRISSERGHRDLLSRILYTDVNTYLQELLMKQDNMSMATSIESRVPFLDHKLVEAVWRMPSSVKLRGITTKWVLRKMMSKKLPRAILKRSKRGFPAPLRPWMRQQHHAVRSILTGQKVKQREILDHQEIQKLFTIHESGRRDCTFQLWRLLCFELWCRIFFDRDGSEEEICMPDQTRLRTTLQIN
jgi:asparagine synthase (glutamine-hydrolysing)